MTKKSKTSEVVVEDYGISPTGEILDSSCLSFIISAPSTPGDPRFFKILDEMREMHIQKAHDYGAGQDYLANLRASAEFGIPPWVGCMLRANDKMTRIKAFIEKGELKNESLEDSLRDIAAYAVLALILLSEERVQ